MCINTCPRNHRQCGTPFAYKLRPVFGDILRSAICRRVFLARLLGDGVRRWPESASGAGDAAEAREAASAAGQLRRQPAAEAFGESRTSGGPVLDCIEADFCSHIFILQDFSRSKIFTLLHRSNFFTVFSSGFSEWFFQGSGFQLLYRARRLNISDNIYQH